MVHGLLMLQQIIVIFTQLMLAVVSMKNARKPHHGFLDITVQNAGLQEMSALVLYMTGLENLLHYLLPAVKEQHQQVVQ